jgi:hypothetical protein
MVPGMVPATGAAEPMELIDASDAIFFRGGWDAEISAIDFRLSEICTSHYFRISMVSTFRVLRTQDDKYRHHRNCSLPHEDNCYWIYCLVIHKR